jgi:hypothetical protein
VVCQRGVGDGDAVRPLEASCVIASGRDEREEEPTEVRRIVGVSRLHVDVGFDRDLGDY